MADVVGAKLQRFNTPGSLGVVKDTRFLGCFWPVMDAPFSPFAEGSEGIHVDGPPTPRNIIFPPGTTFGPRAGTPKYFRVTHENQDVTKMVPVRETITVRGQQVEAEFKEQRTVNERVRIVTEISEQEARR